MTVPVYKRILDLFEAEGINTIFGIPDPNFVHMFAEADARGWTVVAPHHEERRLHGRGRLPDDRQGRRLRSAPSAPASPTSPAR